MRSLPWFALALVSACDSTSPRSRPLAFSFAQAAPGANASFTVQNTSNDVVWLPRCGEHVQPAVDRMRDGKWENASAGVCIASVNNAPTPLEVGASRTDLVYVTTPGVYRIRLYVGLGNSSGTLRDVVSQSFTIE